MADNVDEADIRFTYDGRRYAVSIDAYYDDGDICLPDGTYLTVDSWFEPPSPEPSVLHVVEAPTVGARVHSASYC